MESIDLALLVPTRRALHALAEQVISPVRQRATGGRIALQARPGGFGTQDLPGGGWAGVRGTQVVVVDADGGLRDAPITTLRAAAAFVGDPAPNALSAALLAVDGPSAARLATVFDGGTEALTRLLADAAPSDDVSGIDLWPEHFDVAATLGSEASGTRANYGVSPGDDEHPAPYAYVGPWTMPAGAGADTGWNATGFAGAERPYVSAADTLAFWQDRRRALAQ